MDQQHHRQIHDHECNGIHQCGNTARTKLPSSQFLRTVRKILDLALLHAKRPQHTHTGKILAGSRSHLVQRCLHALVHGHGDQHDAKNDQAQHRNQSGKHKRRIKINGECHDHGAEYHEGRPKQQPQGQIHTVLHLIDIGGHAGHHSGCTDGIDLGIGKSQNMRHNTVPQTSRKSNCRFCRKKLGSKCADHAHDTQSDHHKAHFDDIALITILDTGIHDGRDN